jgi:hypothetical protein
MAEQSRLDVLAAQRLAQQRIVEQVDLADRQIVRRGPVRVEQVQVVSQRRRLFLRVHGNQLLRRDAAGLRAVLRELRVVDPLLAERAGPFAAGDLVLERVDDFAGALVVDFAVDLVPAPRAVALDGVTAARRLSKSLSSERFVLLASRRSALSAFSMSR